MAEAVKLMMNVFVQIVIVAFIFILLLLYMQNIYKDDTIEKNYIAKDLALSIEAVQAPQGNTQLIYAKDIDSYTILFKEGRVQVFDARDQPEPPAFLRGISSYSIDKDVEFEDIKLKYSEKGVQPVMVKTDNQILMNPIGEYGSLKLYSYEDIDTKQQPKNYKFYTNDFQEYVEAQVDNLNSIPGTQFSFSSINPDFMISKSYDENIIYCPANKEKRKLASLIANDLIDHGTDVLILPSKNDVFTIRIQEESISKLSNALKESFKEYYDG